MPVRYLQNSSVHVNSHYITSLFWTKEIFFLLYFNGSIWTAGGLVFRTSKPMDGLISNVDDSFVVGIPGQNTFWSNIAKPALCPAQGLCAVTFLLVILTHWGRDKMGTVFNTTLSNAFSWMKIYQFRLWFHWIFSFMNGIFCPSVCLPVCPSVCLSVCLSVTPFWLCSHHRIIMKFSGVIT